jgi:hypothetical protein
VIAESNFGARSVYFHQEVGLSSGKIIVDKSKINGQRKC